MENSQAEVEEEEIDLGLSPLTHDIFGNHALCRTDIHVGGVGWERR